MNSQLENQTKAKIERILNLFPEVTWDRFAGDINSDTGIGVFGWLARPDGKSDFLYLRVDAECAWLIATSSAKYSAEFSNRLGFTNHSDCKRVKEHFPSVTSC